VAESAEAKGSNHAEGGIGFWQVIPTLLVVFCFFVYVNSNTQSYLVLDGEANAHVALSIIRTGDFNLDEFKGLHNLSMRLDEKGRFRGGHYSVRVGRGGHYVSGYPVGNAVMAAPVFGFLLLFTDINYVPRMSVIAMSLIASFSVLFVYLAALRLTKKRWALSISLVYAFCTVTWSVSSQSFWQHAAAQLCLSAALFFLLVSEERGWGLYGAGFAAGYGAFTRPLLAVPGVIMFMYAAWRYRLEAWKFVAGALPGVAAMGGYSWWYFGAPWRSGREEYGLHAFTGNFAEGLSGLLASPARGLLMYSPVFVLLPVGAWLGMRKPGERHYYLLLSLLTATYVALLSKWFMWYGGGCFGYRLLSDVTPAMCLLLIPAFSWIWNRKARRGVLVGLVLLSWFINFLGANYYNYYWDTDLDERDVAVRLWEWRDSPVPFLFSKMLAAEFKVYIGAYDPQNARQPPTPKSYFRFVGGKYLFFLLE